MYHNGCIIQPSPFDILSPSSLSLQDKHGTPILCAVCEEGYDRLLEKLLDRGADPNARDQAKANKPAIVLATEGNRTECIKLLMVSGVDKNAVYDATGISALQRYNAYYV